ncbi:GFA family protein [Pseudidiomarina taiwanensis]|uniref:Aldehyde-activating protein n=1 Tax=Pseudidiomarina taiwanensis TaxID=337250 RepID=A0A432ZF19_9GAMM|nr:GFA family protein [Pseudidiomarina taiwanensis]RUO76490.1 aldehyde-activating protein [Pseudidiomarina taiwanensis]
MTKHFGSCLCGQVTFAVKGDFDSFYLCHCKHCQKDTGSAHAANLFSQSAQLEWLSGEDAVTKFNLAGTRHSRSFCQHCGSAVPDRQGAEMLVVPAGSIDSELPLPPAQHIFLTSRAAWDKTS